MHIFREARVKQLHITNGDVAAGTLKESSIEGDVFAWRDPMHHGPFPAGLGLDELNPIRAAHLASPFLDVSEVERDFALRNAHLKAASSYDHVVLWFEHDLLDQLQILQILDWFATADLVATRLELICIDAFSGITPFLGIGQLDATQMASLYDIRQPVTSDMLALAQSGWAAFRSPDPRDLLAFCQRDHSGLPFLKPALQRYFEEFPHTDHGLSRSEFQLLSLVSDGVTNPADLFRENMALETSLFVGDWHSFALLERLCDIALLTCETGPFWYPAHTVDLADNFAKQRFALTEFGQQLIATARGTVKAMTPAQWLGGVEFTPGQPIWTWSTATAQFERSAP